MAPTTSERGKAPSCLRRRPNLGGPVLEPSLFPEDSLGLVQGEVKAGWGGALRAQARCPGEALCRARPSVGSSLHFT